MTSRQRCRTNSYRVAEPPKPEKTFNTQSNHPGDGERIQLSLSSPTAKPLLITQPQPHLREEELCRGNGGTGAPSFTFCKPRRAPASPTKAHGVPKWCSLGLENRAGIAQSSGLGFVCVHQHLAGTSPAGVGEHTQMGKLYAEGLVLKGAGNL